MIKPFQIEVNDITLDYNSLNTKKLEYNEILKDFPNLLECNTKDEELEPITPEIFQDKFEAVT